LGITGCYLVLLGLAVFYGFLPGIEWSRMVDGRGDFDKRGELGGLKVSLFVLSPVSHTTFHFCCRFVLSCLGRDFQGKMDAAK